MIEHDEIQRLSEFGSPRQEIEPTISEFLLEDVFIRSTIPGSHIYPEHSHDTWEILYVAGGKGTETVRGFPNLELERGNILCLPPHTFHESIVDNNYRSISVRMKRVSLGHDGIPFCLKDNSREDFRMLATMMLRLYIEDYEYNSVLIHQLVECLIYFVRLNHHSFKNALSYYIEQIKDYICDNFQNSDIDISKLIDESGYSPNYLITKFREAIGVPPHKYLLERRIEYADMLLKTTQRFLKIEDVAYESGFNDYQYFSRVFKKYKGYSPSFSRTE